MFSSVFLVALGVLGVFSVIAFFWLFHLLGAPSRLPAPPYNTPAPTHDIPEPEHIRELHRQAFVYDDFDALEQLAHEYGGATEYWENQPDLAPLVAQGVRKLAELVDSDNPPRPPEPADFYYMGLMYEQGFECEPDLEQALLYFKKALQLKVPENPLFQDDEYVRIYAEQKVRRIENFIAQQYFNRP